MNYKRNKPRVKGCGRGKLCGSGGEAPSYWNILFHTRPTKTT